MIKDGASGVLPLGLKRTCSILKVGEMTKETILTARAINGIQVRMDSWSPSSSADAFLKEDIMNLAFTARHLMAEISVLRRKASVSEEIIGRFSVPENDDGGY